MNRFDIAVIGGGPAGCTAAISAALAGATVALIDRQPHAASVRIGELLEPDGVAILAGIMGAEKSCFRFARVHSIGDAWHDEEIRYNDFAFHPAGAGHVVDRAELMQQLRNRTAQLGVCFFEGTGTVKRLNLRDWQCTVHDRGTKRTLAASMIVLATGRGRCAMRPRVSVVRTDRLLAMARLFLIEQSDLGTGQALLEAAPSSWWFGVPFTKDIYAVSCFSDSDIVGASADNREAFFETALRGTRHLRSVLYRAAPLGPIKAMDAASCCPAASIGPDWICAGDSASALDPLTGFGLKKALVEGSLAGAYAGGLHTTATTVDAFRTRRDEEWSSYLRQRSGLYASAGARFGTEFWSRRTESNHASRQ